MNIIYNNFNLFHEKYKVKNEGDHNILNKDLRLILSNNWSSKRILEWKTFPSNYGLRECWNHIYKKIIVLFDLKYISSWKTSLIFFILKNIWDIICFILDTIPLHSAPSSNNSVQIYTVCCWYRIRNVIR